MKFLKSHFIFVLVMIVFSFAHTTFASLEITEIMYDPDGSDANREWVEIHNTGSTAVDVSKIYFFTDNTNHSLTPDSVSNLPADGYAIIAQKVTDSDPTKPSFRKDWPPSKFSGILFDSSWAPLSDEGETMVLKDSDKTTTLSSVTYTSTMGGANDGNSLQKIGSSWSGATPTPGTANQNNNSSNDVSSTSTNTSSGGGGGGSVPTNTTTTQKAKEPPVPKISTEILAKNVVVAGLDFPISALTTGYSKETLFRGKFVWNFGDGTEKEENEFHPLTHMYQYAGDYVLTLTYSQSYYATTPDATDRMIVKVIPSDISIIGAGNSIDAYVEIENKSLYEIALSKWVIKGILRSFTIPEGTIILPNRKLRFAGRVIGFDQLDVEKLELDYPNGDTASLYPVPNTLPLPKSKKSKTASSENNFNTNSPSTFSSNSSSNSKSKSKIIDLNELGASAGSTGSNPPISWLALWAIGAVIIVGTGAVFLSRKKLNLKDELEKEIHASDITIIE